MSSKNQIDLVYVSNKEEDYLRAIYKKSTIGITKTETAGIGGQYVSTNELSTYLKATPPAITDMVKKLHAKELVLYRRYQGVKLSKKGLIHAKKIIRKQCLWQVFLVNKLKLELSIVTDISDELEHVDSDIMLDRLDDFIGNPVYSPFGESIPTKEGTIIGQLNSSPLASIKEGTSVIITAMRENNPKLTQYFYKKGIYIGAKVVLVEKLLFDESFDISIDNQPKVNISKKVAENVLVSDANLTF